MYRSGVPMVYADAEWPLCPIEMDLRTFTDDLTEQVRLGRGLTLVGGVGVGKSSSAGLIAREALMLGVTVRWSYVPDLLGKLNDWKHREQVVAEQNRSRLVIWDDFTATGLSVIDVQNLDRIVENRYRSRLSIVVTTNMSRDALNGFAEGGRMIDRWKQRNPMIVLPGDSMRKTWKDR